MNPATIIITAVIALLFSAIVITGIRNKKKGKHSCACGSCSGCTACGDTCQSKQKTE